MLWAGLQTAAWVSVADTGERHASKNGFCTPIGNDDFAWFATQPSKSRSNFLDLLRTGRIDHVINDAALDCVRRRALGGSVIEQLAAQAHLDLIRCRSHRIQSVLPRKAL